MMITGSAFGGIEGALAPFIKITLSATVPACTGIKLLNTSWENPVNHDGLIVEVV